MSIVYFISVVITYILGDTILNKTRRNRVFFLILVRVLPIIIYWVFVNYIVKFIAILYSIKGKFIVFNSVIYESHSNFVSYMK